MVSQPAKVFHVVRETQSDDPVAVLVADPDAPTYRYRQIKEAIAKVGAKVDWENTLSADAAAAVYATWRPPSFD